ncbi:pyrroline-5-carboxylate reductase [Halapricum sp. CBA1109]|uniref:pyrroline-5-carboxylate reductase n=1 Tax=Halapricum sp. CBA1109 TaxID=2668068 RepID=UPI0012F78C6C|nr:pyrroline-5-carboxylate reductase [Halapricum sp. CBA1109]MUV90694.1 pyrroline-5-carboxylate reductase [Halapricum sp. CBA1109]
MVHVSVIGCGNMGGALVAGLASDGTHTVTAIDADPDALDAVADHCEATTTDLAAARDSDVVVLAVKPDTVAVVLEELSLQPDQTLVTVAAGVSTDFVQSRTDAQVVRIMPNLAAETGDMAAAVTDNATEEVLAILEAVGEYAVVEEDLMDVSTAVNGSGPAFVFYLVGAMKQAGIDGGLDPHQAETLAAQTFKGAAETVLRDDRTVDELIDAVCSPNGTTIEGMEVLWDSDAEEAVIDAVAAAEERSKEIAADFEADDE